MKRRIVAKIFISAALSAALTSAACSRQGDGTAPGRADAPAASAWTMPPKIDAVLRQGDAIVVRGAAGPNARVVLRGRDGSAVAVGADGDGRFELRAPATPGDQWLKPEVQIGEDAVASPATLVLVQGGVGPIALLAAGRPSVRLDGEGVLDAVDADGRAMVLSGRSGGAPPDVLIDGARMPVVQETGGRWRVDAPGSGPAAILVDGRAFAYPGAGGEAADFKAERAGQGWRLTWPVAPRGRQTTWLPDRLR